ncbi:cysteine synthase A [Rhodobacteraceae bacterium NNCM2]|nr:cysteine synthase A [Coraliihabitans acroporae]
MNDRSSVHAAIDTPGRGRVYQSILDTAGHTPLVRLGRMAAEAGCRADILVKLEFFNPIASVKDRIAVSMLEAMEEEGLVTPQSVIVEPTAGNTGIGLAASCAAKGLRCVLVMPEGFSTERVKLMRFLGAEVVLTPLESGIGGSIEQAMALAAEIDHAVIPWQYGNEANPETHRVMTAEEIWNDTGGAVDAVVLGVGTGGTLTGVGEALKRHKPGLRVIAVEPASSAVISGGPAHPHGIQGIGTGFVPEVLNLDLIDEVMTVTEQEALATARRLAVLEGIPAGISSGAALCCALRLGAREEMAGKTVVTLLPSPAERYLTTELFDGF